MLCVMFGALLLSADLDSLKICTARGTACSMRTSKTDKAASSSSAAEPAVGPTAANYTNYDLVANAVCSVLGHGEHSQVR